MSEELGGQPSHGKGLYRYLMFKHRRVNLYGLLLAADVSAILLSFMLVSEMFSDQFRTVGVFDNAFAMLPIFVITAFNRGAYSIEALKSLRIGVQRSLSSLAVSYAILFVVEYFLHVSNFGLRGVLILCAILSAIAIATERKVIDRVIIGPSRAKLVRELLINDGKAYTRWHSLEYVDAAKTGLVPNLRDPMMLDRLARRLELADRVVVACDDAQRRRDWATLLKGANIQGEILATELDELGAIGINRVGTHTTLEVSTNPLSLRSRMAKRLLDLAIAVPVLVAAAPVLILVAILIRLDSTGPIFFRQERVGRSNALFKVYKFRSMYHNLSDQTGSQSATRGDDRITRVGRILRRSSIDELPQLLNVLFGSMSIVGPRPHALGSLAGEKLFWDVDERYWHRHALKPGITGLAQVRGLRGATNTSDDLAQRLQADINYIAQWSLIRDLWIMASTVRVLLHSNAY